MQNEENCRASSQASLLHESIQFAHRSRFHTLVFASPFPPTKLGCLRLLGYLSDNVQVFFLYYLAQSVAYLHFFIAHMSPFVAHTFAECIRIYYSIFRPFLSAEYCSPRSSQERVCEMRRQRLIIPDLHQSPLEDGVDPADRTLHWRCVSGPAPQRG